MRSSASTVAVLTMVVALAGCGGGDDDGGATGSGSATGSPSPSLTPTVALPDPTPTVEPASGPRLDVSGIRVNAPDTWRVNNDTVFGDTAGGREGSLLLTVAGTAGEQLSLKQAERYYWSGGKPDGYESQDDLVMGGLTASYYTAPQGKHSTSHVVSTWDVGYAVQVEIIVDKGMAPERQQEILGSILASYQSPRTR